MATQACNHCHKEKPVTEFNWRWKALGIRQGACRDCQKKQKNEWYLRNQESERERLGETGKGTKRKLKPMSGIIFQLIHALIVGSLIQAF